MFNLIAFLLLAFLAEIVGTIGGFGSSVFFVPLAQFLFDFQSVLMLTALLHNFSNSAKLVLFYRHLDYQLLLLYGLPSTVFVVLGAWLSKWLHLQYLELTLGVFLLVFASFVIMYPSFRLSQDRFSAVTGGSVAGFLAGLIGTGGAIRGMSLAAFNLEKSVFIATSAGIDFFVDISRTIVYWRNDYYRSEFNWYVPMLILIAFAGSYMGKRLLGKLSQDTFRKIVLSLLILIGITMIAKTLTGNGVSH